MAYSDEAVVEEEANEAGGEVKVTQHVLHDCPAHNVLGLRARVLVESYLETGDPAVLYGLRLRSGDESIREQNAS